MVEIRYSYIFYNFKDLNSKINNTKIRFPKTMNLDDNISHRNTLEKLHSNILKGNKK